MFFHGALGKLHGLGDLRVGAAVDAIEQENPPGPLGQAAQGGLDPAPLVAGLERLLGTDRLALALLRQPVVQLPLPRSFATQVVDGQVARAAQEVAAKLLHRGGRAPPEAQEQFLDQVGGGRSAADPAADQAFHALALGQEGLEEIRAARRLAVCRQGIRARAGR
ncbi:Uncharacterised protein [Acinetobacter baumannii]|nr:Uncharacterised protein [Acinetobacter baumannii]